MGNEKNMERDDSFGTPRSKKTIARNRQNMKKFISMGSNSSVLLLSLIDDILDLTKIEQSTFSLNMSDFILIKVVKECYDIFYFQCALKKIKIELVVPPDVEELKINSDSGRLKQVLLNLLSNSFKFTFQGHIKIILSFREKDRSRFISIMIEDTGIGIKKEDQQKLFKLFGMISDKKMSNVTGSGIGLNISKKYVDHLNGEITLESKYEQGTTVEILLPLKDLPNQEKITSEDWEFSQEWVEKDLKTDSCIPTLFSDR